MAHDANASAVTPIHPSPWALGPEREAAQPIRGYAGHEKEMLEAIKKVRALPESARHAASLAEGARLEPIFGNQKAESIARYIRNHI